MSGSGRAEGDDVVGCRGRFCCCVPLLGENRAGKSKSGHLLSEPLDLVVLVRDGLLESGDGFPKSSVGFRSLRGLVADAIIELVNPKRVSINWFSTINR
jgi:hypothetical protein